MQHSKICLIFSAIVILNFVEANNPRLSAEDILQEAIYESKQLKEEEEQAALNNKAINKAASRISAFLSSTPYIKAVGYASRTQLNAIKKVLRLTGWKGVQLFQKMKRALGKSIMPRKMRKILSDGDFPEPTISECPFPEVECDPDYHYRSIDGTCNNLKYPNDGRANRALARFLPPDYDDGIEEPRRAKSGNPLPSTRNISLSIYEDVEKESGVHTVMLMTFGQVLDHDVDKTAVSKLLLRNGLFNEIILL